MTINEEKIVELLAERSGLTSGEVEKQLENLRNRIDSLEQGETFLLDEIGTFKRLSGSLLFEPTEIFARELNYKYAGMGPIEIVKPKSGTIPPVKPSDKAEDSSDKSSAEKTPPIETGEDIKRDDKAKKPEQEIEFYEADKENKPGETSKHAPASMQDDQSSERKPDAGHKKKKISKKEAPEVIPEKKKPTPASPEKEKTAENQQTQSKPKKKRKVYSAQEKAKKDSIFSLVNTIVALIILSGIIYLVYRFDDIKERRNRANIEQQTTQNKPNGTSQAPIADNDAGVTDKKHTAGKEPGQSATRSEHTSSNQTGVSEELSTAGAGKQMTTRKPKYGLRGEVFLSLNNGYTIVLHSFKNKASALYSRSELRAENYRVVMMPHPVGPSDTTWRVGVGQFETVQQAKDSLKQLNETYQENHFIKRISL